MRTRISDLTTDKRVRSVEIKSIDANRWAFLQLPVRVFIGILLTIHFIRQEQPGSLDVMFGIILITPATAFLLFVFARLNAFLFNMYLYFLGKGPIIEIEVPKDMLSKHTRGNSGESKP